MTLALENISLDGRLRGLDLRVQPGQLHVLIGPNGAGKSSALGMLAGDLTPTSGRVTCDGASARGIADALARRRAVLPQRSALTFDFRVADVVALGRHPHDETAATRHRAVADALTAMDLAALADRGYQHLSGGEAQRTQIARVLAQIWEPPGGASAPRYLLLDEPAASLDLRHQHALMTHLGALCAQGVGVLCVLHDLQLAHRYADQVSLLAQGRRLAQADALDGIDPLALEHAYGIAVHVAPSTEPVVQVGPT